MPRVDIEVMEGGWDVDGGVCVGVRRVVGMDASEVVGCTVVDKRGISGEGNGS